MNILLIDDEQSLRKSLRLALETMGHRVTEAGDSAQAQEFVAHTLFDVVFLDLRLGQENGLDVLPALLRLAPGLADRRDHRLRDHRVGGRGHAPRCNRFLAEAVHAGPNPARARSRREAASIADARRGTRRASPLDRSGSRPANTRARPCSKLSPWRSRRLPPRRRSFCAARAAPERGCWREPSTPAVRGPSDRSSPSTVPALSAELLETELFGHVRGAFTGAVQDTVGKAAAAEGGTLFLDEIGDLPVALQPKLLRLLQEKRYERVGEAGTRSCDVRIIAATNHDLQAAVARGAFPRGSPVSSERDRTGPAPPCANAARTFCRSPSTCCTFFARQAGKTVSGFTEEARTALLRHPWPGNVRELRNAVERGLILSAGPEVGLSDLPAQVGASVPRSTMEVGNAVTLEQLEAEHIRRLLAVAPTMEEAAALLGIDPSTLYRKRKRYGLVG